MEETQKMPAAHELAAQRIHHTPKKEHPKTQTTKDHKWLLWASIIQIILLVFVAFQINGLQATDMIKEGNAVAGAAVAAPPARPAAPTPQVDMTKLMDDDAVLGDPDAPITIVEFSDYQCPFCGKFYQDTLKPLKEKYVKTGKVKFIYRDFPLSFHPEATPAAIAAECAGDQGKYYEYHDLLFENQQSLSAANYERWASQLGLNLVAWKTCLQDPKTAAEVRKDMSDGGAAGVQGTPATFVNGQLVSGAQPFSVFEQIIEAALS